MYFLQLIWTEFVVLEMATLKRKQELSLSVAFLEAACLGCFQIMPGWRAETVPGGHRAIARHLIRVALSFLGSLKLDASAFSLRVQEDQITGVTLSSWSLSKHSLCTRSPMTTFVLMSICGSQWSPSGCPCGLWLTSPQPRDAPAPDWQPGGVELWR